jgi:outer membrane cobalamin receptor
MFSSKAPARLAQLLIATSLAATAVLAQTPQAASPPSPPSSTNTATDNTTLKPVQTTVTVNGSLTNDTPASLTVLNSQDIQLTPGLELDDRLRQVPGFSLFRRTSSVVANPTTQGVSLRGVGSSGASRTLVLWDSIPINDPFGGWVYWDRFDPNYLDRIEILEGATTSVFGDRAMSGTISIFSAPIEHSHVIADVIGGNAGTLDTSAGYSDTWGPWGLSVHSREFTTDGYYITNPPVRGSVDDKANVRFATGDVYLDYLGTVDRLSIHIDVLAEERQNGTDLTHNSTGLGTLGLNWTHSWTNDQVSFLGFHTQGQFHSTYSSVSLDRDSEKLVSTQRVPEYDVGGAAYWRHHGSNWNTIVGSDSDDIHGTSYDYSLATRRTTPSGGTLLERGVFAQGDYHIKFLSFYGGIREQYTGLDAEHYTSPNGGIAAGFGRFRLHTSAYHSYRAPTLNELFRPFRVGNVQTLANSDLTPEGLLGVEAGVDWTGETTKISATLFHNDLNNLIDNATLSSTPTLIIRRRENFPTALSQGFETKFTQRWRKWTLDSGYIFLDARLSTGQRIPEVPKQQGTGQLTYARNSTLFSFGVQAFGLQFDDDLNHFLLPGYSALNATLQQHITSSLSALASVQNLLDRTYLVALTPTPNVGQPRLWQLGLRWNGKLR